MAEAEKILMELCQADLRCLDAHSHLGNLVFKCFPQKAMMTLRLFSHKFESVPADTSLYQAEPILKVEVFVNAEPMLSGR